MKQTIASVRARYPGRLAPGRDIAGITIDRFEDGKIVEAWRSMVPLESG
jgi:hypothetical protein